MKVIDCFPFFDEFLILDIRLRELYDVVDKFIVVESTQTFSGKQKPLYLSECIEDRYPQYKDKIDIIAVGDIDTESTTDNPVWAREYYQKNHICKENLSYLNLDDGDLILFADADEIPKRSIIQAMRERGFDWQGGGFGGPCYYYKLNILTTEWSFRPKWISYKHFDKFIDQRHNNALLPIPNTGWHFSYLKKPEDIKVKIEAFSHQEFNVPDINNVSNIEDSILNVRDLFNRREVSLSVVEIDDSFPEYVKENKDLLKEWIADLR
jgi:beta-1,4-mannosyl-glycoprotein beta-1,4-N-acetylglucosaminyltransferase